MTNNGTGRRAGRGRGILLLACLMGWSTVLPAQYSSNSLYSLYGIGDLTSPGSARQKAMGGAGIALKSTGGVNLTNPASLTEYGTHDVIFDIGLTGYYGRYLSRGDTEDAVDFTLDQFSLGFPVTRWWGGSIGVRPYSTVGYDILTTSQYEGSQEEVDTEFVGTGGVTQFYMAHAIKLFQRLSLGANVSYLMGSIDQTEVSHLNAVGFYDVETRNSYFLHNFNVEFGMQYEQKLGPVQLNLGATYSPAQTLSSRYSHRITVELEETTTLVDETGRTATFDLPEKFGLGLALSLGERIALTGDYSLQEWTGEADLLDVASFTDRSSYRAGLEFVPNPEGRSYMSRVAYRAGAYHKNSYIQIRDQQITDYGVTLGLGLPPQAKNTDQFQP
ncbi:MAG: hypothetical protein R2751_18470 [Bacteroidales bacterium]